MKKWFGIILAILFFTVPISVQATNYMWWATGLTGGGNALDGIDGAGLTDGDGALCIIDDSGTIKAYFYRLEDYGSSPPDENPPSVITPDTNPGNKRWELVENFYIAGIMTSGGGFMAGRSPTPGLTLGDSDTTDSDDNAKIYANADDLDSGEEDIDIFFQAQVAGALITFSWFDADTTGSGGDPRWISNYDFNLASGRVYMINGSQINIGNLAPGGDWTPTGTIDFSSATDVTHKDGTVDATDLAPDAKFQSLLSDNLTDTDTPHILTAAETTNKVISNYDSSGEDREFVMPAPHAAGNIIFTIGDEFQVDITPDTGDLFYLNGTAMAINEKIQNTADTLGDRIVGYCVNINGTLRWMFYGDDNWVEETP